MWIHNLLLFLGTIFLSCAHADLFPATLDACNLPLNFGCPDGNCCPRPAVCLLDPVGGSLTYSCFNIDTVGPSDPGASASVPVLPPAVVCLPLPHLKRGKA